MQTMLTETFEVTMAYFAYCDGQQLAPTVFGSTDSTSGQWKIKTKSKFYTWYKWFLTILKDGNNHRPNSKH